MVAQIYFHTCSHADTHTGRKSSCRGKHYMYSTRHDVILLHFHLIINLYLTQYHFCFDPLLSCEQEILPKCRFLQQEDLTECNTACTQHTDMYGHYWPVMRARQTKRQQGKAELCKFMWSTMLCTQKRHYLGDTAAYLMLKAMKKCMWGLMQ